MAGGGAISTIAGRIPGPGAWCASGRGEKGRIWNGGVKVPYELQVDVRPLGYPDGWLTMPDWEYPCMEDAEIAMERVQAAFPHAKLRVVNVVRVTDQQEEAT